MVASKWAHLQKRSEVSYLQVSTQAQHLSLWDESPKHHVRYRVGNEACLGEIPQPRRTS